MIRNVEKKIRQIRDLKGYSQEYVASALGISTRAYSKIESGETQLTINRLNQISEILGVNPREILGFDTSMVFNNSPQNQAGGQYTAYNNTEIEYVRKLYEKLLAEKDEVIRLLKGEK
jgi:transcriptional regulator with XRE-family HTH domain